MADFGPPARKRRASGAGIAAASSELPGSRLRVWLLEMHAWGLLTPQQLQASSERALHDAREKRISDLEPLARLGSSGRHSNNVNRDLVKLVGQLPKMYDPSRITLRKSAAEVAAPIEGVPADEHAYTITFMATSDHAWTKLFGSFLAGSQGATAVGRSSASSGEIPEQTAASVNPRRRNSDTKQG